MAYESQWSRFVELDAPNGAGGGAVWEGDVGDFDLHEVAPSLADLIDAVATAMEIGIARPHDIRRLPDPGLGRAGLGSIENGSLAGSANRQRPCHPVAAALARDPGAGSGATRSRAVPRRRSPRSASSATAGRTRRRSAGRSGGCTGSAEGSGGPLDDGTGRLFVFVPPGADPFRLLQNGTPLELDVRPFDDGVDVGSSFDRSAFEAVATAVRRDENP